MPVLLNDFKAMWADIRSDALAAVDRVGQSGWLVLGAETASFESKLAALFETSFSVGCANGLDALEIGLRALGLKAAEKVLTTPLSAFASSLAILRAGGVPCYVDVDDSGLIDLDLAEQALKKDRSIRFLMPVHLYGHAVDLNRLEQLRDQFQLQVVEDCAQAIGTRSHGRAVGSVGQVSAVSFYPTKNLGCLGDGGALICSSAAIARAAKAMRDYGQSQKYVHDTYGMNSRLDELQAGILNSALLPRLENFTHQRTRVAERYMAGLKNASIKVCAPPKNSTSVWHLFPVLVERDRAGLQAHLRECEIQSGVHYPHLISEQHALREFLGVDLDFATLELSSLERARTFCKSEISLPIHPYLSDEEVERVTDACNSWKPASD